MEEKINKTLDLLEILKVYCDFNYDKNAEIPTIGTVVEIALENQKELAKEFDYSFIQNKKEAI